MELGSETIELCTAGPGQYNYQYRAVPLGGKDRSSLFQPMKVKSRNHPS